MNLYIIHELNSVKEENVITLSVYRAAVINRLQFFSIA